MKDSGCRGLAAFAVLCGVAAGCAQAESHVEPPSPTFDERGVVNEAWRILKMTTGHDIITSEDDGRSGDRVGRCTPVAGPRENRYAEALIYIWSIAGEGEGGHVPAMRFQRTACGEIGVVEY